MSELIDREKFIYTLIFSEKTKSIFVKDLRSVIEVANEIQSAEPERKKGEWIKEGHWGRSYKCNQCGNYLDFDGVNAGRGDANFCPNCGAKMEETK